MGLGVHPLVSMGHTLLDEGPVDQQSQRELEAEGKAAVSQEHLSLSANSIPADTVAVHEGKKSMVLKSSKRPTMGIISEEPADPSQGQFFDTVCWYYDPVQCMCVADGRSSSHKSVPLLTRSGMLTEERYITASWPYGIHSKCSK